MRTLSIWLIQGLGSFLLLMYLSTVATNLISSPSTLGVLLGVLLLGGSFAPIIYVASRIYRRCQNALRTRADMLRYTPAEDRPSLLDILDRQ